MKRRHKLVSVADYLRFAWRPDRKDSGSIYRFQRATSGSVRGAFLWSVETVHPFAVMPRCENVTENGPRCKADDSHVRIVVHCRFAVRPADPA